jgi:hypothetical protein
LNVIEPNAETAQLQNRAAITLPQSAPPPPENARYDVFLCHNSLDKTLVKDVADTLQLEAGILFFLDEFSIPPSVEFLEFIRSEMSKSAWQYRQNQKWRETEFVAKEVKDFSTMRW